MAKQRRKQVRFGELATFQHFFARKGDEYGKTNPDHPTFKKNAVNLRTKRSCRFKDNDLVNIEV